MNTLLRNKLLAYLGGVAIAFSTGSVESAKADLAVIPEPVMEELLGEVDQEEWRAEDLVGLVDLLASDPRRKVRCRIAELFTGIKGDLLNIDLEHVMTTLAQDEDPLVRSTLARSVAEWLSRLGGFERTRVVLEWALSADASVRHVVAKALSHGVETLGGDLVVEHLGYDRNSDVRIAVVEAAAKRYQENPALYSGVLSRLSSDHVRSVRRSARRAAMHHR